MSSNLSYNVVYKLWADDMENHRTTERVNDSYCHVRPLILFVKCYLITLLLLQQQNSLWESVCLSLLSLSFTPLFPPDPRASPSVEQENQQKVWAGLHPLLSLKTTITGTEISGVQKNKKSLSHPSGLPVICLSVCLLSDVAQDVSPFLPNNRKALCFCSHLPFPLFVWTLQFYTRGRHHRSPSCGKPLISRVTNNFSRAWKTRLILSFEMMPFFFF